MIDKCILKDTKIFEFFFNDVDVFYCICNIFQCISMYLEYLIEFECIYCISQYISNVLIYIYGIF
jgi:hypothetical protein